MISEEIENELEALKSIYVEDFEERPPVWKRPCFCVRVKPTTSTSGEIRVEATLKFTLVAGYPKVSPKVEVDGSRGLSASDVKLLAQKVQETVAACVGQEMCHDVIFCTQQFLESNNVKPQTFYEAMVSREKRESEALKSLRGKDLSSDGKRARAPDLKAPALPESLPAAGAINIDHGSKSLLDASTLDFKQSSEFLTQQRLLNKASKQGKRVSGEKAVAGDVAGAGAGATAGTSGALISTTPSVLAPQSGIDNSDSMNLSSLNASVISSLSTTKQPKSSTGGGKTWAKLFVNHADEDDDDGGTEDGSANGDGEGTGMLRSATGNDNNRLVPVIGRTPTAAADSSRYSQEFVEISRLGSGASGQVWKVRNKLDRRIYAIKKIDLNAPENASVGLAKIRREVTTISRLLHKHIVRYYAAWVEESQCTGPCEEEAGDTNATATLTLGASSTGGSSSASSALGRGKAAGRTPEYLAAVVGGPGRYSAYGGNDFGNDFSQTYNKNPDELWTFEQSEPGTAVTKPSAAVVKPVKGGSRFFSYGAPSSSDDSSDDSGSESDSSSESDGSEESEGGSGSESDSDSASGDSSSDTGDDSGSATRSSKTGGIAAAKTKSQASTPSGTTATPSEGRSGSKGRIPKGGAAGGPKLRRWMFIQMEYCYTTLREVIDQGQLWQNPSECGKLLRQTLEALVYIHDRRVIHRDLKPANIFIDSEGNIKIGDFGLATSTLDSQAARIGASTSESNLYNLRGDQDDSGFMSREASTHSLAQMDSSSNVTDAMLANNLTGGIGTAMYRAPEQEYRPRGAGGADKGYDDKADMFSLGVILFEMCQAPFSTGMERLLVMKKLRENAELPAQFGETYSTPALGDVIRWLVQHDPDQRPTAAQLLASSLVPARVDTDSRYLKEITEALWKPNSSAAVGIISVLFNNSINVQQKVAGPAPGSSKAGGQPPASMRLIQDTLPAVSYDLEVLQHSLNILQPRSIPRGAVTNLPAGATKAAKTKLRLSLQQERSVVTLQYSTALKQRLRQVFESHGAVPYAPGLLQLRSNPGLELMMRNADRAIARLIGAADEKENPSAPSVRSPALAQFLDPVGQVVVLPSDLVTPFAKLVAFLNLQHSQRYNISQVYTSLVPPDSAAIEDTPAIASHDHPFISEEAVYDVVLPLHNASGTHHSDAAAVPDPSPVLQADFEVLSAAIEAMSHVQPYLPDCAIRVNDPRIMDAIIELCAWDLEGTAADKVASKQPRPVETAEQCDRESLFKIISLASDGVLSQTDVVSLIAELRAPPLFQKRLSSFAHVFCIAQDRRVQGGMAGSYLQQGGAASLGRDPLHLLDVLEHEFYKSEVIVDMQRRLAAGPSAIKSASQAASDKDKKKPSAPEPAPVAPPAPAVSDFTQLNFDHIGKKQPAGRKKDDLASATSVRGGSGKGAAVPETVVKPAQLAEATAEDAFKEDRRRIRTLIKNFDSALTHLRQLVKAALNCTYGLQHSSVGMSTSFLLLVVDLGKDPRYISSRAGSSMLCPFHARGFYFVIESYLFPSEQFINQQLQAAKDKDKPVSPTDSGLLLRCSRRRHNRFGGVLGEGGHFEHLVDAYADHFQQVGCGEGGAPAAARRPAVTACAIRLKLDSITQLVTKYEARQRKIADHLLNRGSSSKYHFVDRFKTSLTPFLDGGCSLDVLLAMEALPAAPGKGREEAAIAAAAMQSMLLLLRRHRIRASDSPHQLQGASQGFHQHLDAALATTLCAELGIPFAVVLNPEAGNKITLQYCGDIPQTTTSLAVAMLDLPRVLQECIAALRSDGKFSFAAVVAGASGDSSATARSPGRASAASASAASNTSASTSEGQANAGGAGGSGKNQKVRFGSFDIKNPGAGGADATGDGTPTGPAGQGARTQQERVVQVVVLDAAAGAAAAQGGHNKDWQQYNNPKEKKQAVIKKKELEQVPGRVRALLLQTYMACFAAGGGAADSPPNITPLVRSLTAPYAPGSVLVVDAPFAVLRSLCTILMTKLHSALASSAAREEYEALAAAVFPDSAAGTGGAPLQGGSGNCRKVLKQAMSQLLSYAKQVTSGPGPASASTGAGRGGGASSGQSGASGSQLASAGAAAGGTLQLYLYSQTEHQMDLLCCDAKALLNAKFN